MLGLIRIAFIERLYLNIANNFITRKFSCTYYCIFCDIIYILTILYCAIYMNDSS